MNHTDNVVKLNTTLKNTTKIQFSHTHEGPIIETSLAENLILRRFLTFALSDVQFQLDMVKKSEISKQRLEENIFASGFIIEYLKILLEEIENGIKSAQERK